MKILRMTVFAGSVAAFVVAPVLAESDDTEVVRQSSSLTFRSDFSKSRPVIRSIMVDEALRKRQAPIEMESLLAFADLDLNYDYQLTDGSSASAQDAPGHAAPKAAHDTHSLASKLQNPIADLIQVPFQFNWDTGIGSGDRDADKITLKIQPVIPFNLSKDWNLITRTIIPVEYAESPASGISSDAGLGDTAFSAWFTPTKKFNDWILGVGPVFEIPTGSNDLFRSHQLSMGPTAIALKQEKVGEGTLTFGALAQHIWKVAGPSGDPTTNSTFFQPFISYTMKTGTTFALNTETTYNWQNSEWTIPINLTMKQLVVFGKQPTQFEFGPRYYVDSPDGGPDWGFRFTFTLLFPK